MQVEAKVYGMIGNSLLVPRITHYDEETCCLTMGYMANGNLNEYMQHNNEIITLPLRLKWCRQAAERLALLHSHEIIHCDISPRNFFLDSNMVLKIADFGGASIRGAKPSATPETRSRHPAYDWKIPPVLGDDVFSLRSLIYFFMTRVCPYEGLSSDEVEARYDEQQFPDIVSLPLNATGQKCLTISVL
ncbi:kinase-like domain-containing protein [Aspergillus venezuelensis]